MNSTGRNNENSGYLVIAAFGGGPDRILALHEGVDGNSPVDVGREPVSRTMVRQRHSR